MACCFQSVPFLTEPQWKDRIAPLRAYTKSHRSLLTRCTLSHLRRKFPKANQQPRHVQSAPSMIVYTKKACPPMSKYSAHTLYASPPFGHGNMAVASASHRHPCMPKSISPNNLFNDYSRHTGRRNVICHLHSDKQMFKEEDFRDTTN
jgi:hypothetical protein